MAQIKIVDTAKKEVGSMDLAADVFEVEVRREILNLVVRAQRAARRAGTHATLNRAKMKGGGAKPWRQKGTGRARAGTNNSPVWRGGATIFGPQPRDYSFKVNKKVRKLALRMALSSRLAAGSLMVVNAIEMPEIKTKLFAEVAGNLELKKALIVVDKADNNLALSARNIPGITVMTMEQLNVYDVLRHGQLVMTQAAAESVQERLK